LPMRYEDLDAVMRMERLCFETPWSRWAYATELQSPLSRYLVLELAGEIIGYIGMKQVVDEAHVMTLATHPDHRRRGYARRLIRAGIEACPGASYVYLEVRQSNQSARRLYESLGFEAVGVRRKYYEGREDAVLMTLNL
jgi:ribosomal-protein-alanine N-acetyltransferase